MTGPVPLSRNPLLAGALLAGVLFGLGTEFLGALGLISRGPVVFLWLVGLGALAWRARRYDWARRRRQDPFAFRQFPLPGVVLAVFVVVPLVIGVASAPNNWDGLSYHLPRVERWVEQGHLGLWATPVDRQLFMAPWAGYAMLHLRLLTGGDQFAFLPSWLAFVGCILLVIQVARQLGATPEQALFGGLLMATAPVAVLHASSVQTDLITAFWVLCTAALAIDVWLQPEHGRDRGTSLALAAAVALAVASKATAVLAVAPWLALYAVAVLRQGGLHRLGFPLLAGVVLGAALAGPALLRNLALFGRLTGPDWVGRVTLLQPFTPNGAAANVLANIAVHGGTLSESWNEGIARGFAWFIRTVVRADPASLFPFTDGFQVTGFSAHESAAGVPLLLVALATAVLTLMIRGDAADRERVTPVILAGLGAFFLHAALVRWQPFGARLQLGSLVWVAAVVPVILTQRRMRLALSGVAVALALPALLAGQPRPLLGERSVLLTSRSEQLAMERSEYFSTLEWTVLLAGLSNCHALGILTSYDFPEYYLSAVARREGLSLRWRYIGDVGESTSTGPGPGTEGLCMVLVAEPIAGTEPPGLRQRFRVVWEHPPFEILEYLGEPPDSVTAPAGGGG